MRKLRINKKEATFSVPSVFVDRYMAQSDGDAVKVYLYLLCYLNNSDLTLDSVASALGITPNQVTKAISYWHDRKVVSFSEDSLCCNIEFLPLLSYEVPSIIIKEETEPLKDEEFKKIELPEQPKYFVKDINAALDGNKDVKDMFLIAEQLLCKTLNHNELKIMYSFHDWLKLPTEVIVMLLEYCTSIKKLDLRYIEKVAITWAENGIDNFEKANIYIKGQAKLARMERKIKKIMQISGREFTELETGFVRSWIEDMKANEASIKQAYEITVMNTGKTNFKYMDAVLKNILGDKTAPKKEAPKKKTNFNNFSTDENISDFEKKMIERRMSRAEK